MLPFACLLQCKHQACTCAQTPGLHALHTEKIQTHVPTQTCTYKIIGITWFQVAGIAKASSDKSFSLDNNTYLQTGSLLPPCFTEYCAQLPFPGCCTVLITALPLQILFENLICSITDNKGITWCMPCIFGRLFLAFVSYF